MRLRETNNTATVIDFKRNEKESLALFLMDCRVKPGNDG
jgi:hypothetical protein